MTAPLGRNIGGYGGDTIDIDDVLQRTLAAAQTHGWSIENFPNTGDLPLYGLQRLATEPRLAVYISTGIHGDEPAGPLAMLGLIEANTWPSGVSLFACPCLNPTGFPGNTRENQAGIDLNRDYRYIKTSEVQAHTEWIDSLPTIQFWHLSARGLGGQGLLPLRTEPRQLARRVGGSYRRRWQSLPD